MTVEGDTPTFPQSLVPAQAGTQPSPGATPAAFWGPAFAGTSEQRGTGYLIRSTIAKPSGVSRVESPGEKGGAHGDRIMWELAYGLGALVLLAALAYGFTQWRREREQETPAQTAERNEATRQRYRDSNEVH